MTSFYGKPQPEWCEKNFIKELDLVINQRMSTLLVDSDPHLPSLIVIKYSRFGNDANAFDTIVRVHLMLMEVCLRRFNCQSNGAVVLIDCSGYPLWLLTKFLNPAALYNVIHSQLISQPLPVKAFHLINFPLVGRMVWHLLKPIISHKLRRKFYFYGSDWSLLKENVDHRLLPEEFGGSNGPLNEHEEAFAKELQSFARYCLSNDQNGF